MSTSSSSSLPSSSAVTIPIPGKSILKRRPPPTQSLFSRFSRFLPSQSSSPSPLTLTSTTASSSSSSSASQAANGNGASGGNGVTEENERSLRRAHFILPHIATVYPISSQNPPSTPQLKDEKRAIEERERERRRRVVRSNSVSSASFSGGPSSAASSVKDHAIAQTQTPSTEDGCGGEEELWSANKVESFYRECCEGCDESPDAGLSRAFKNANPAVGSNRTLDISGVQLTITSAQILSDVLTIEWGLRKLVCKECDLDEHNLKPILHSLLIPDSLTFLSLASNKRLKTPAFRLIGAYLSKSSSLTFLDLSQNPLDKKSIEHIVASLAASSSSSSPSTSGNDTSSSSEHPDSPSSSLNMYGLDPKHSSSSTHPGSSLVSLRMDDCNLRGAPLEVLARSVRTSTLRHISLRHNRIPASGAVALALMIRDYPDVVQGNIGLAGSVSVSINNNNNNSSGTSSIPSSIPNSPVSSIASLPSSSSITSPPGTPTLSSSPLSLSLSSPPATPVVMAGPLPPPPRHPLQQQTQTTYTPYIPRAKKRAAAAGGPMLPSMIQNGRPTTTFIASSSQGGITARMTTTASSPVQKGGGGKGSEGPSAALLDKYRALNSLPRIGSLRTLDLKGNDLRNGITYIAQVLKRNRTLKVLNLSENKLDVQGLVAIAEAMMYNSCLETLDLSKNPCSGPQLDGIQSLRTAFTPNTTLKRLFLSSTSLTSAGAIALAEFLPESNSLLHLDLTQNKAVDLAGVMALNEGLKSNWTMRCLDLDVPAGDEGFSKMCREILKTCVRNTEEAERVQVLKDGVSAGGASGASAGGGVGSGGGGSGGSDKDSQEARWRGQAKGVWMMLEESELAKVIRMGNGEEDVVAKAKACIRQMQDAIRGDAPPHQQQQAHQPQPPPMSLASSVLERLRSPTSSASSSTTSLSSSLTPSQPLPPISLTELVAKAKGVIKELGDLIQGTEDVNRMEELFGVNDELVEGVERVEGMIASGGGAQTQAREGGSVGQRGGGGNGEVGGGKAGKPVLTLKGLGLKFNGDGSQPVVRNWVPLVNGHGHGRHHPNHHEGDSLDEEDEEEDAAPPTPRLDKGKEKAAPEPEEMEKVLSPTRALLEANQVGLTNLVDGEFDSEDEDGSAMFMDAEEGALEGVEGLSLSPGANERSKSWVEEEGEVFRKGTVLLGPEEMEGEYAGEELRKELLDAMVERPQRRMTDEFGFPDSEHDGVMLSPRLGAGSNPGSPAGEYPMPQMGMGASPVNANSPVVGSPISPQHQQGGQQGQEKPVKLPPRPYISRSRSSSSLMSMVSANAAAAAGSQTPPPPVPPIPAGALSGGGGVGGGGDEGQAGGNGRGVYVPRVRAGSAAAAAAGAGGSKGV